MIKIKHIEGKFFAKPENDKDIITLKAHGFIFDEKKKIYRALSVDLVKDVYTSEDTLLDTHTKEAFFSKVASRSKRRDMSRSISAIDYTPAPEPLQYKGFQKAGIKYIATTNNTLLADDMGLGKTIQAIGALNVWKPKSVLIVCPATVKIMWANRLKEWLVDPLSSHVVYGAKGDLPPAQIYIVNYDLLMNGRNLTRYNQLIKNRRYDVHIVDESQYLINSAANRTQLCLSVKADKSIFMTGTPAEKPIELWAVLNRLCPEEFDSYYDFAKRYCDMKIEFIPGLNKKAVTCNGAENLLELQNRMRATVMCRRTKEDVGYQLPKKQRTLLPISLPNTKEAIALKTFEDGYIREALKIKNKKYELQEQDYEEAVSCLSSAKVREDEHRETVKKKLGLLKVPFAIRHIKDCLGNVNKLVVITMHVEVIKELSAAFPNSVFVDGSVSATEKEARKNKFINDPTCRIYFGQLKAMGVGTDGLHLATHKGVVVEISESLKDTLQGEDRLDRIGQKFPVQFDYLVWDKSLEVPMVKRLENKKTIYSDMFN